jgi:hypothetical protein
LTDGVLILRHLFGFSGASLVSGAVDLVECAQCTSSDIAARLAVIQPLLDIDGDGQLDPLTDGVLVERWLFGFSGAPLVSSAVDLVHCTRCSSGAIAGYLSTLGP